MPKLVNELFELSKLEAHQVQPTKELFFVSELVNDICSKYHVIAERKDVDLQAELCKEMNPVYADLSLIERVIQNLIDNALKFTPAGGHILIQTRKGRKDLRLLCEILA